MRLNKTEREDFRKVVKILIPQMEKSEIVYHFQKKGFPRKTIYSTINCMQQKENWLPNLLDTCQKKNSLKD